MRRNAHIDKIPQRAIRFIDEIFLCQCIPRRTYIQIGAQLLRPPSLQLLKERPNRCRPRRHTIRISVKEHLKTGIHAHNLVELLPRIPQLLKPTVVLLRHPIPTWTHIKTKALVCPLLRTPPDRIQLLYHRYPIARLG